MAIAFPSSPTLNQTYTYNSITWTFDGIGWTKSSVYNGPPTYITDVDNSSTGFLDLPVGTTAQRPVSPANGYTRINSTTNYVEVYYNNTWNNLNYLGGIVALGGTITTSGNYKIHTFNGSGVFEVLSAPTLATVDLLVVAGGGTGGLITSNRGGGGGAGGLIYIESYPIAGVNYTVTVGAGGASASGTAAVNGTNSTIVGNSGTITALGGGFGGYNDNTNNQASGGSGGGGWYPGYAGGASTQPVNTYDGKNTYANTGFGNAGGTSGPTQPYGAGGGGAGSVGRNYNDAIGPMGGLGRSYSISGSSKTYAGGGSSGGYAAQAGTSLFDNTNYGGLGGGGTGYCGAFNVLSNAAVNTGGGGGSGGSGGSGVVIIKYRYQ